MAEEINFLNARKALYSAPVNPNRPTINTLYEKSFIGRNSNLTAPEIFAKKAAGVGCRYSTNLATWGLVGVFGAYWVIQPNLPNLWSAIKREIFFIEPAEN